ncbi:MAG: FIST N-terminal domain-containing protein [Pseudomonadota bacterium]
MDGGAAPSASSATRDIDQNQAKLVRRAHAPCADPVAAAARIAADLGPGPFSLVALFVSPTGDLAAIEAAAAPSFPGAAIIGCSTAGEISPEGYANGEVVAIGLPDSHFNAYVTVIDNLDGFDRQALTADLMSALAEQAQERPDWRSEFAFLMIDGLSLSEDRLAAALSEALGPVPLFGGSAGDGLAFNETRVMAGGAVLTGAAVVALIRTACRVETFRLDHLTPTDQRMVVTGADPARRIVTEINAEPAAREYARVLGKDPDQLTPFIFAAHPVLVRIGGDHFVRAIREVAPNGDLIFFSAIDEGLVLTLAEPEDMARHLDAALTALSAHGRPDAIIACDCILRRLEAEQNQASHTVSAILARHRVVGFNTYGEQSHGAHMNQTMTGVAVYPPNGG